MFPFNIRRLVFLINTIILLLFASCSKDYSYEGGLAKGDILKDSLGNCSINTHGLFYQNKNLDTSNYLELKIDFSSKGIYSLTTDTVDGFYFSGVNNIVATGVTTVKLKATGKPLLRGSKNFKLKSNFSDCNFFVNVVTQPIPVN